MEITLRRIENGHRIVIEYTKGDVDHLDLPKGVNCHDVIDAMYRLADKVRLSVQKVNENG